jgi:hypothetical protein
VSTGARPDLIWVWVGDMTQFPDYYFEVTIWLVGQKQPIDVAWARYPCYRYDQVPEGREGQTWEFRWSATIVEGIPGEPKDWSPVQSCGTWENAIDVWNPGTITRRITEVSEQRSVKVDVINPIGEPCPPGGCQPDPTPGPEPTEPSGGGGD